MRYRRLTPEGDYTFGHGKESYLSGGQAVQQAIKTRLLLLYGEWWENTQEGLPLFQQILGRRSGPREIEAVNLIVKNRIAQTPHVKAVLSCEGNVGQSRVYTGSYKAETDFGAEVAGTITLEVI